MPSILLFCSILIKWAASWENQIFAYAKTKTQISFAVTAKLISAFVFTTWIVEYLFFLNPKFQVSMCDKRDDFDLDKVNFLFPSVVPISQLISFACACWVCSHEVD